MTSTSGCGCLWPGGSDLQHEIGRESRHGHGHGHGHGYGYGYGWVWMGMGMSVFLELPAAWPNDHGIHMSCYAAAPYEVRHARALNRSISRRLRLRLNSFLSGVFVVGPAEPCV